MKNKKKKILVIDDDEGICESAKMILEFGGYQPLIAMDESKALALVKSEQPDFILLDYMLTGNNGIHVLEELRKTAAGKDVPVVMFSAHVKAKTMTKNKSVQGFLEKPFDIQELFALIEKLSK